MRVIVSQAQDPVIVEGDIGTAPRRRQRASQCGLAALARTVNYHDAKRVERGVDSLREQPWNLVHGN